MNLLLINKQLIMKDLSKLKLVLKVSKFKPLKVNKDSNTDGFNGYGKQRSNQNVFYGYFTNLKGKSGIYCITCKINNQHYIGCSKNIYFRVIKHYSNLRLNVHPNKRFQIDYNKYGFDNFDVTILEETNENLLEKERDYQNSYGLDNLYNLSIKGTHHSDAQRLAWASQDKSNHKTEEYRNKMSKLKQNKIGQFDRNDFHKIAEYENSTEACKAVGAAKSTLLGCCNGSKKSCKGYIFRYLDKDGNIIDSGIGRNRNILIHNEDIV